MRPVELVNPPCCLVSNGLFLIDIVRFTPVYRDFVQPVFDQHLWFEMAGCSTYHLVMKCHEHHLEAPFHSSNFTAVMLNDDTKKKVYRCDQNLFRHNLYWNPTSGVPWLI